MALNIPAPLSITNAENYLYNRWINLLFCR